MPSDGLRISLELTEFGARLLAQRYRLEHPDATEQDVVEAVARWMTNRRQAPDGDGWGRRVPWPRPGR